MKTFIASEMLSPASVLVLLIAAGVVQSVFVSSDLHRFKRDGDDILDNGAVEKKNNCKCVRYYQCDRNNTLITDGKALIEPRGGEVKRIFCKSEKTADDVEIVVVCCKVNGTNTAPTTEVKSPDIDLPASVGKDKDNVFKAEKALPCGAHKTIIDVRIFAGEDELTPLNGEFPWIAAIFKKPANSQDYKFICSSALIHPKVVVTANHCVQGNQPGDFRVIVNGKVRLPKIGSKRNEEREVVEIIHHPNYNSGSLWNDVALLILKEPYDVNKTDGTINTLCLPPSNINLKDVKCLVAGWGKDASGKSKKVMKKVELPYVEYNKCQDLMRRTRLGQYFNLHESFVCAGGEKGKDACKGDGGSPLMCPFPNESRYFHMGIVSWGIGCGDENVPGVYGNVPGFSEWIRDELIDRDIEV